MELKRYSDGFGEQSSPWELVPHRRQQQRRRPHSSGPEMVQVRQRLKVRGENGALDRKSAGDWRARSEDSMSRCCDGAKAGVGKIDTCASLHAPQFLPAAPQSISLPSRGSVPWAWHDPAAAPHLPRVNSTNCPAMSRAAEQDPIGFQSRQTDT